MGCCCNTNVYIAFAVCNFPSFSFFPCNNMTHFDFNARGLYKNVERGLYTNVETHIRMSACNQDATMKTNHPSNGNFCYHHAEVDTSLILLWPPLYFCPVVSSSIFFLFFLA